MPQSHPKTVRRSRSPLGGRMAGMGVVAAAVGVGLVVAAGLAGAGTAVKGGSAPATGTSKAASGASGATPRTYAVAKTAVTIPVRDGVQLSGSLFTPTAAAPARGWPVVVMPGTFAGDAVTIDPLAELLAKRGYVVLSYKERGFSPSGLLEGGGPADVADVSQTIDWTLARPATDKGRVAIAGVSYGAGIGLQASLVDHRVKSVVEIAGWADMEQAFYPNRTPATATLQSLLALATLSGRIGPELKAAAEGSISGKDVPNGLAFARARSATRLVNVPGANRPALFMSHEMNETVFQVDQSVAFWDAYPGRKRLDLRVGDHGTQELTAQVGIIGPTWYEAMRWLDATVAGTDTSILREPKVKVQVRTPSGNKAFEAYSSTAPKSWLRSYLSTTSGPFGVVNRTLTSTPVAGATSWRLRQGQNWLVHTAAPLWTYAQEAVSGTPPNAPMLFVDQKVAGVWSSAPLGSPLKLRGPVKVHLTLTPSAAKGTVVVHVLDLDAPGITGYMIAHQPYTWSGATPGRPMTIDLATPWNAFTLPAGHRLAVLVSTSDPSFSSANPKGSTVTVGPDSWVDVPVR